MSESEKNADPLSRYHEANLHDSRGELLSNDNARWLANQDYGLDSLVRLERIRNENPEQYVTIIDAIADKDLRRVLLGVVQEGGQATYNQLQNHVTVSLRTLKKRLYELQDRGVIEIDDSKPAVVYFPSDAIELLVEDAFSMFFSM